MKERQIRYTAYAGRLVEILAEAEAYYQTALAEEMTRLKDQCISPMLIGRIAEGRMGNQSSRKRALQIPRELFYRPQGQLRKQKRPDHGVYETIIRDRLTEEEQAVFDAISADPNMDCPFLYEGRGKKMTVFNTQHLPFIPNFLYVMSSKKR